MNLLTVRQLEYIVAVAEHGSLSAAARACFVAQPSLAEQVGSAERALGVQLFVRGARRTTLTPAGHQVVDQARVALEAVRAVSLSVRFAGALRVGAIETVAPYVLGSFLQEMRTVRPKLRVVAAQGRRVDLLADVAAGRIDAAIVSGPVPAEQVAVELGSEELLLAVPAKDRLKGPATLTDLVRREILLLEEGHCLAQQSAQLCESVRAGRFGPVPGASVQTLVEMVASNLGCTILPAMAVAGLGDRDDLRVVRFAEPAPTRTLMLVHGASSAQHTEHLAEMGETLTKLLAANATAHAIAG